MLNKRQTARFCGQLKMMLSSGIPLLTALKVIGNMQKDKKLRKKIEVLNQKVSEGAFLSAAGEGILPEVAIASLKAAERSGDMVKVLGKTAGYFEKRAELDEKIIAALVYPVFVIVLSLIMLFGVIIFIIPTAQSIFSDLEVDLPMITRFILALGAYLPWIAMGLLFLIATLIYIWNKKRTIKLEKLVYKVPYIGSLLWQDKLIQFFCALSSMIDGGVPLLEAIMILEESQKSLLLKNIICKAGQEIRNGEYLSSRLEKEESFNTEYVQMLKIGENSGNFSQALGNIVTIMASEREYFVKRFCSLLEPGLTLMVGLFVGLVAVGILFPFMSIANNIN
ncbi:MAG: type II secretion system F family protein [Candidatus Margulisiibacteriota bacterium]